ncbi:MAG: hypothetical protein QOK05_1668 [Chloroflexota bacterium]|jgi:hypothetical protein|nr:hypothetical protein [Chloroflexota bacterium]
MNFDASEGDQQDLPWNDSPADSEAPVGSAEPEPAEVVGDEGEEEDSSGSAAQDPYARDTLDQRLAEEEPDAASGRTDEPGVQLVDPARGGGDVELGEDDSSDEADPADISAEESAVHVRDDIQ